MLKFALVTSLAATFALSGCGVVKKTFTKRSDPDQLAGHLIGPPVGVRSAEALSAEPGWQFVAPLTGVAAGTIVARRQSSGECAYAQADGTFRVLRCG